MFTLDAGTSLMHARFVFVAAMAALLIAALSVALPAAAQPADPAADLQGLVNDLGLQLELRYRANVPEYAARYEQLGQAVATWNASERTNADRAAMAAWLREAIRSTMPGSERPMPSLPQFGQSEAKSDVPSTPVDVVSRKPVVPEPTDADDLPTPPPAQATSPQPETAPPSADALSTDQTPAVDQTPAQAADDQGEAEQEFATAQPVSAPDKEAESQPGDSFWRGHPAAGEMPEDLLLGNPFQDDPSPGQPDSP